MVAYLIQIFLYRFIQLILFKLMYKEAGKITVILIDNERTWFQLAQLASVFIVQLSIFVLLLKKVYFKKYFKWLIGFRQTLNPFLGIFIVSIPVIFYFYYKYYFFGGFKEGDEKMLFLFVVFFFVGALTEELIFRGYFYKLLIKKNIKYAIPLVFFQAFLFTIMHFNNPGHTYTRIAILFIAGILLGVVALRGFIYALSFHFLWNFLQAYYLGIDVSGYRFTGSIMYTYQDAPAWENSIYTGLFLAATAVIVLVLFIRNRKQFV
jgi:membrane protease YdiL (CAAX protease family)